MIFLVIFQVPRGTGPPAEPPRAHVDFTPTHASTVANLGEQIGGGTNLPCRYQVGAFR